MEKYGERCAYDEYAPLDENEGLSDQVLHTIHTILLVAVCFLRDFIHNCVSELTAMHPSQEEAVADQLPLLARSSIFAGYLSKDERSNTAIKDDDLII